MSNPNANPKKLSRKDRKRVHNASQIHGTPIKSGNNGSGFVSSFNRFMQEFNSIKDGKPRSFESWRAVRPIGLDDKGEIVWSTPRACPRKSQTSGIKHVTLKESEKIRAERQKLYSTDSNEKRIMNEKESFKATESKVEEKHKVDFASN